jgi:hypothetical protein
VLNLGLHFKGIVPWPYESGAKHRPFKYSVWFYLDLQGNTRVMWEQKGTLGNESAGTSGIASPEGRHIAMTGYTLHANMWMLEDF